MSCRHWLYIAAFGGLIFSLLPAEPYLSHAHQPDPNILLQPKESVEGIGISDESRDHDSAYGGNRENPNSRQNAQQSDVRLSSTQPSDEMMRSISAAEYCDDECQHNKRDLKAQEGMADAAWAMFALSVFGTCLTGIGVVFVYLNLREARVVSAEAKKSSDAAVVMAEAMIGIELPVIQPRWAGTDIIETDALIAPDGPYGGIVLERPGPVRYIAIGDISFRNFGRTVAIPSHILVGFNFCNKLPSEPAYHVSVPFDDSEIIKPDPQDNAFQAEIHLGIEIGEESATRWQNGEVDLWLYCALSYRDFLGKPHTKRFCARWAQRPNGAGTYYFASDGSPPESYTRGS